MGDQEYSDLKKLVREQEQQIETLTSTVQKLTAPAGPKQINITHENSVRVDPADPRVRT